MSFVGEAIARAPLSPLFDVLLQKLESSELFNFTTGQVCNEIKKWERMLTKLQIVLEDAEEKQITNPRMKSWLVKLKHLAYDVEDILDDFSTECLRRKVNGQLQATATTSEGAVMFNEIPDRFNEITHRFNEILEDKKDLKLIWVAKTSIPYDKSKSHPSALSGTKYAVSNWELFAACFNREIVLIRRNSFLNIFRTCQVALVGFAACTVFLRTRIHPTDEINGNMYLSCLFFLG